MRYLNKIIFINSAKIKYGELSVEGTAHFTGTQGVGKSTVLRALLFFYNANVKALGIPPGQKSFLDFYLPHSDSYIVYEVIRETGPYCVFIFRSQGRVAYRFIDTGYQRNYFIDNQNTPYENDKIRMVLGSVNLSRKIDSYDDFRNILYGNSQAIEPTFRKYAIVESKQYQNIPRTIQNVFLNSKLEADFIKDTIIRSLNEDIFSISLSSHSNHLKDFKTNLSDIEKWTAQTKSGEIVVRTQAQKVVDSHTKIKNIEQDKLKIGKQIGWTMHHVKTQQPIKLAHLAEQQTKINTQNDAIENLKNKHKTYADELVSEIGILKNKLNEIKTKTHKYAEQGINEIIERVSKKEDWVNESKARTDEKDLLTANFKDIESHYNSLIQQAENQLKAFENQKGTERNEVNAQFQVFKEALNTEYEGVFEDIRQSNQEQLKQAIEVLQDINAQLSNIKVEEAEAKHKRFYEKEIANFSNELTRLKQEKEANEQSSRHCKSQISVIQKEWDLGKQALENEQTRRVEANKIEIEKLSEAIWGIKTKIETHKDSFYGWLNENQKGWEQTIGKVVSEKVLFQTDLSPAKTQNSNDTFYGVEINLDEISAPIKTIADYEQEIVETEYKIETIKDGMADYQEKTLAEIEKLRKKYQPKINEYKDKITTAEYEIGQNETKTDDIQLKLNDFTAKALQEKTQLLTQLDTKKIAVESLQTDAKKVKDSVEAEVKTETEAKKKEKAGKETASKAQSDKSLAKIKSQIQQKQEETTQRIATIKTQQSDELNNKGADSQRINTIEQRLEWLKEELTFIEENRDKVADFNKDKRELFDKKDEFARQKQGLETKQTNAQQKFEAECQKIQTKIGSLKNILDDIDKDLENIKTDLDAFEKLKKMESFLEIETLTETHDNAYKTDKQGKELIDDFNSRYYSGITEYQHLQSVINKFNGNFTERNIFKFQITLIDKEAYLQFATDLKEFLDEDKIKEYQNRVSERFAAIIGKISTDTNDLFAKRKEVENIIGNINDDFIERNFAGVIKGIEIKTEDSSSTIIKLLIEIKRFKDDNEYQLGETSLFSQSNKDNANQKAVDYLSQLDKAITDFKKDEVTLGDAFELKFRVKENDNDTGWVEKLANVGSNGTDVLVKAIINIMLLNVFKSKVTKNKSQDFRLHCMMDEIGTLHSNNVKGILQFASDRNIILLNSSPESLNALAYKYTYHLSKDEKSNTVIKNIITNRREYVG
jgi:chromosome segregation ATPase